MRCLSRAACAGLLVAFSAGSAVAVDSFLSSGALASPNAVAGGPFVAPAAQERTSYLGPEEGETLTAWTERWLDGPIQYIATEDEREIYDALETTAQRLRFIRAFWERRDPTQRGRDNEAIDEFVRRVEYANEEFTEGGRQGWETVFGRVVLVLGVPQRTERQPGLAISQRPAVLWSYDRRIPDWPINEMLLFVFQRGRWRLYPPSNLNEPPGVTSAQRDLERASLIAEVPTDFERARRSLIQESLVQTVNYNDIIETVGAEVAFPDAEIPFAWEPEFGAREAAGVAVTLRLSWRMESLIFHAVEQDFEAEMVIYALVVDSDGEPVAETSEAINVSVPVDELEARSEEIVERTITLQVPPGTYQLTLSLDDHLLGYRSVYRSDLVVPEG